jgi:hypothetical protein
MCSSPKSSGSTRKSQIESIFGKMDPAIRVKFADSANRAQQRKEQRLARNSALPQSKKTKPIKDKKRQDSPLLTALKQLGFSV